MIYIKPEVYGSSDLTSGGSQIRPPQDLACYMTAKRAQTLHFLKSSVLKLQYVVHETGSCFRFLCQALFAVFSVGLRRCATMHCLRQNLHEGSTCPAPPASSPVFCLPHLAARREAPIITASEGKKCTTPHSVVFCTIAQFVLTKKTLLISSNFKPNVAYQ